MVYPTSGGHGRQADEGAQEVSRDEACIGIVLLLFLIVLIVFVMFLYIVLCPRSAAST
jgi:hypothetical protein